MEALLLFFTGFGIILIISWLLLCGVVNVAAFGIATVQYVKEEIEESENAR